MQLNKGQEHESVIQNTIKRNTTFLADAIPLDTPYMVFIDPCNICNFKCDFCAPQTLSHTVSYRHMQMDFENYKRVIDDIARFPKRLRMLRLYTMGEPLLNRRFPDMVAYAKQKNVSEFIETVTNGSMLRPELNRRLAESGIDRIRISIEGINDDTYSRICRSDFTFGTMVEQIADLFEQTRGTNTSVYVKTIDALVDTEEKREQFYHTFESISDSMFIESMIPAWPGFDELDTRYTYSGNKITGGQRETEIKCCPFIFYGLVVNPDGVVTPCCSDWERGYVYGNAFDTPIYEIWGNEKMQLMWKEMLKGNRARFKCCAHCRYYQYTANDNLDGNADELLMRLDSLSRK